MNLLPRLSTAFIHASPITSHPQKNPSGKASGLTCMLCEGVDNQGIMAKMVVLIGQKNHATGDCFGALRCASLTSDGAGLNSKRPAAIDCLTTL